MIIAFGCAPQHNSYIFCHTIIYDMENNDTIAKKKMPFFCNLNQGEVVVYEFRMFFVNAHMEERKCSHSRARAFVHVRNICIIAPFMYDVVLEVIANVAAGDIVERFQYVLS